MLQRRRDGDGNYLKTAGNRAGNRLVGEKNGARFCDFNLISQKKSVFTCGVRDPVRLKFSWFKFG